MQTPQTAQEIADSSTTAAITDAEFTNIRNYLHDIAGIDLAPTKKALVISRLSKRLRHYRLSSYAQYLKLVTGTQHPGERQMMLDLLTTNETYFFREPGHLDFLRDHILAPENSSKPFRVWSGAASSGEEAYSIAMVLEDKLKGRPWEIIGTDISNRVLKQACSGHYSMARTEGIPQEYLQKYCLRGTGPQEGTLLVDPKLRQRVSFLQANLNARLPDIGMFDVIFLRNVLIYFNNETKRQIVSRIIDKLNPWGYFFISHTETLHGVNETLERVAPAIYVKS